MVLQPVLIFLPRILPGTLCFYLYYLLSIFLPFIYVLYRWKSQHQKPRFSFYLKNEKVLTYALLAAFALQFGIILPLVRWISFPEFLKHLFYLQSHYTPKGQRVNTYLLALLVAPIVEEIIFRGIILDGFLKRFKPLKAILMSSFLFGFIHLNPWQFVATFLMGTLAAWTYYRTRSLMLCMLIHFVNNVGALSLTSISLGRGGKFLMLAYGNGLNSRLITLFIVCLVILVLSLYKLQVEFTDDESRTKLINTVPASETETAELKRNNSFINESTENERS